MIFGVPKEVRELENRVGLTPVGARALVQAGHTVYVQHDAGTGSGYTDEEYRESGATIVYSAAEAYGRADIVAKVARPTAAEHALFRPGQMIFAFLSLAVASPDFYDALTANQITAVAYEMIEKRDGSRPVLRPASEIAGRLAPIIAGHLLMRHEGRGILLGGLPGIPPAVVVVLGAGILGRNAARAFLGMGSQVLVLDHDMERLRNVDAWSNGQLTTMYSTPYNVGRVAEFADVVVGAVSITGQRTPILVRRQTVENMRSGTIILDFDIDNGGCVETSRPTTLANPTFVAHDVVHHCVPNITAAVSRTTSRALTYAALPYLLEAAKAQPDDFETFHTSLMRGINLYQGKLANAQVAAALGREVELELPIGVEE